MSPLALQMARRVRDELPEGASGEMIGAFIGEHFRHAPGEDLIDCIDFLRGMGAIAEELQRMRASGIGGRA